MGQFTRTVLLLSLVLTLLGPLQAGGGARRGGRGGRGGGGGGGEGEGSLEWWQAVLIFVGLVILFIAIAGTVW